ncbi:MAG: OmpA family protein [Myxococcales bacterium]|nr:OmpA family protein [Myxococcales bacterium]
MKRLTVVFMLLSGACVVRQSTHDKALTHIKEIEADLEASRRAAAADEARVRDLNATLERERGEREASARTKDEELARIRGEKETTVAELEELRRQRDAQEQRLAAYRELQQKFRALVDSGKLAIGFRNGQMVVKLPSSILFSSGSDKLSKAGETALADVTAILLEFKDRRFLVAGHTDNVPIKTRTFRNNWVLSTARAVAVLEFMIGAGMSPAAIAAAGYGAEDPVAPNDSEPDRELNRRIEIILVPNLSELPQLTTDQP